MSCLFQLFKKKKKLPPSKYTDNQAMTILIFSSLPQSNDEKTIMELEIGRRLSYLNEKAEILHKNASNCYKNGDIKKAMLSMQERREVLENITNLYNRLKEIQNTTIPSQSQSPSPSPSKIEVAPFAFRQ